MDRQDWRAMVAPRKGSAARRSAGGRRRWMHPRKAGQPHRGWKKAAREARMKHDPDDIVARLREPLPLPDPPALTDRAEAGQ